MRKEQEELSWEERELVQTLALYLQPYTLKSLAKSVYLTEEQVLQNLNELGLLDVVSRERIAERRRIRTLSRGSVVALGRARKDCDPALSLTVAEEESAKFVVG